ncbi:MAG: hypothetical protein QOF95_2661, partial [Pseudonocardiales bacterium]|nr:hypothetical protein [Pseudonocardiales bacterium]
MSKVEGELGGRPALSGLDRQRTGHDVAHGLGNFRGGKRPVEV